MERERQASSPKAIWWRDVFRQWPIYVAGLCAMFITNGTEVLAPKTLQWIIDALLSASGQVGKNARDESFHAVLTASGLFVLVAFVGLLGRVFWRFTLARMTHVAGTNMKRGIWDALRSSALENVQRFTLGDLMNRAIGDVNSARWIYGFTLVLTCDVIFFTTLGAISMWLIHPGLALACLSTFVIFPPIILRLAKREYEAHEAAQNELTTLSEYVSQAVRGVRSQRASNAFGIWISCLGESSARYASLRFRAQNLAINSFPVCSVPTIVSYIILFAWGPQLVMSSAISVGEFAAMASYVYLLQGPVADVGELVAEWQKGFASVNRIAEITELPNKHNSVGSNLSFNCQDQQRINLPKTPSPLLQPLINEHYVLEVAGLKTVRGDRILFEDVNLTLRSGEWLGISGDVGCGKSTLLQNLAGLVSAADGDIRVMGQKISLERRRQTITAGKCDIAYAPERPFVFAGTIRHNLALSHAFTDVDLWHALETVCLADEVRAMPRGLEGVVGEGGVSLSGGQRQRLALARIFLRATNLIILDDPLSAVDDATEAKIMANLSRSWTGQSVIWSSNKLQSLVYCHKIARLTPLGLEFSISPKIYSVGATGDVPYGV